MELHYPIIVARVKVSGTTATTIWCQKIPKGMTSGRILLEYADEAWAGLSKTVVFRGAVTKDVLTNDMEVAIPAEVLSRAGVPLSLGVYGVDAENNVIIPTVWADLGKVYDAADPSGDATTNPTLPVWAQLWDRVPDWNALPESPNHILNRTHWVDSEGSTPTFDGDLTGRKYTQLGEEFYYVRISDQVLPLEAFVGAVCVLHNNGETPTEEELIITEDMLSDGNAYGFPAFIVAEFIIVAQQAFSLEGFFFEKGIHFLCVPTEDGGYVKYCSALEGLEENIHKLDDKYINAEWLANRSNGSEVLLEEAKQLFHSGSPHMSKQSFYFALESGNQYTVNWDGESYECTAGLYTNDYWHIYYVGNIGMVISDAPDTGEPFLVYTIKVSNILLGTMIVADGTETEHTVSIVQTGMVRNRIPFSYMPKTYTFPSDFKYIGVENDELMQAWLHQQNGGEVYASYSGARYKVLQIKYDAFDEEYSHLVMTNGQYLMCWSQQQGWSRYGQNGMIIGNGTGQLYRISVSTDGNLTVNTAIL